MVPSFGGAFAAKHGRDRLPAAFANDDDGPALAVEPAPPQKFQRQKNGRPHGPDFMSEKFGAAVRGSHIARRGRAAPFQRSRPDEEAGDRSNEVGVRSGRRLRFGAAHPDERMTTACRPSFGLRSARAVFRPAGSAGGPLRFAIKQAASWRSLNLYDFPGFKWWAHKGSNLGPAD